MSPNAPAGPDDFREQLSAWHDGALPDETSRFVLKRLLRDDALRAEVGRWQVIGDALRRQPQQRPAVDLAGRVAAAVAADEVRRAAEAPAIPGAVPVRSDSLRWLATAAALGLAAVLMWPSAPVPVDDSPVALVAEPSASRTAQVRVAGRDHPAPMPLRMPEAADVDSLAVAVPPLVRAPQPTPEQLAPLPAVDAPGRPWPRSVSGEGAYTVEYRVPAVAPQQR
jgi:negative regulator of sigma E activity